jgi:hypothetical protein
VGSIRKPVKPAGKIPPPPPLANPHLTLSFKYFHQREPFLFAHGDEQYPTNLLERLRGVCQMTANDFRNAGNKALRCHQIDWQETSEPNGFDHINPQLASQIVPFQFSVSANLHGRVHGFWIEETFFIVWLDPTHALYP